MKKNILTIASILFLGTQLFGFSTSNVQILYGAFDGNSGFDTSNGGKTTLTVEHYSAFEYGDIFAFTDIAMADDTFATYDKKYDFYFEISPRVSLNRWSNDFFKNEVINDVFVAFQYNRQVHQFDDYYAYLYGFGTNLNVVGFNVFDLNIYQKDNVSPINDSLQLSLNYTSTNILEYPITFNGFIDLTNDDLLTQNQLYYTFLESYSIGFEWAYYDLWAYSVKSNTLQLMLMAKW